MCNKSQSTVEREVVPLCVTQETAPPASGRGDDGLYSEFAPEDAMRAQSETFLRDSVWLIVAISFIMAILFLAQKRV